MDCAEVVKCLKSQSNKKNVAGMKKSGICTKNLLGINIPVLRTLAKKLGTDHKLAQELWKTGIHEAKILASMIDDPTLVTEKQMDNWVKGFDSWDVCDQVCMNLFHKVECIYKKIFEWSKRKNEYEKRAAFTLMAVLAVHSVKFIDRDFEDFFLTIKKGAGDPRNYVKKAVNWAIRQIGKRNRKLNKSATKLAESILRMELPTAQWIAKDALKELKKQY